MTCNDVKYTCYVTYLLSYVITDRHVRRGLLLQKMLLSWRLMHHHSILPGRLLLLPHRLRQLSAAGEGFEEQRVGCVGTR